MLQVRTKDTRDWPFSPRSDPTPSSIKTTRLGPSLPIDIPPAAGGGFSSHRLDALRKATYEPRSEEFDTLLTNAEEFDDVAFLRDTALDAVRAAADCFDAGQCFEAEDEPEHTGTQLMRREAIDFQQQQDPVGTASRTEKLVRQQTGLGESAPTVGFAGDTKETAPKKLVRQQTGLGESAPTVGFADGTKETAPKKLVRQQTGLGESAPTVGFADDTKETAPKKLVRQQTGLGESAPMVGFADDLEVNSIRRVHFSYEQRVKLVEVSEEEVQAKKAFNNDSKKARKTNREAVRHEEWLQRIDKVAKVEAERLRSSSHKGDGTKKAGAPADWSR
jgi:hypothetical protein